MGRVPLGRGNFVCGGQISLELLNRETFIYLDGVVKLVFCMLSSLHQKLLMLIALGFHKG